MCSQGASSVADSEGENQPSRADSESQYMSAGTSQSRIADSDRQRRSEVKRP